MRFSISCAAATALIGASLTGGCASKDLPASPVPVVLSDSEAARLAQIHLVEEEGFELRQPASMEPTGDGYIVEYRTAFDPDANPPRKSQLVKVDHDGDVRDITFREDR